jgi:hypothetical protein
MTKPTEKEVARKIMIALYKAWDEGQNCSLEPILEESGYERADFHDIVEKLDKRHGLIQEYGSSYTYDITANGVLYAEEKGLAPAEIIEKHQKARVHILEYLCSFFEREGRGEHEYYGKICEGFGVDPVEMITDLTFLCDIGYIKAMSSSSFSITDEGYHYHRGESQDDLI